MRVFPLKIRHLLDLETFLQGVFEDFSQVPVLQPGELFSDFLGRDRGFLALGQILEVVFDISESFEQIWFVVFPSDFAIL